MIDLTSVVVPDWNRNDATATDNTNAIEDAIADAQASNTADAPDYGGTWGDMLILPKGSIMISRPIVLGNGTSLQGSGDYSTCLVMKKDSLAPTDHFVTIGSPRDNLSSFGGRIRNMNLWCDPNEPAHYTASMVYTNDAQDGTILDHVRLYGFNRRCFIGEVGYGGASIVRLRQVTGNCKRTEAPGFLFDYGESTMVDIDGIEPSGARINPNDPNSPSIPGTVGIGIRGGFVQLRRVHGELLETTLHINMKSARCFCEVDFMTGGPENHYEVVIQSNILQKDRIRLANIVRNGSPPSNPLVLNGQSGASHIFNDIVDPIRL